MEDDIDTASRVYEDPENFESLIMSSMTSWSHWGLSIPMVSFSLTVIVSFGTSIGGDQFVLASAFIGDTVSCQYCDPPMIIFTLRQLLSFPLSSGLLLDFQFLPDRFPWDFSGGRSTCFQTFFHVPLQSWWHSYALLGRSPPHDGHTCRYEKFSFITFDPCWKTARVIAVKFFKLFG